MELIYVFGNADASAMSKETSRRGRNQFSVEKAKG